MKRTKLTEKGTRIPDTRPAKWDEAIQRYLREVEPMKGESARSMRFGMLMQELLGFQPGFIESYIAGVEKYLKVRQKDRFLKGRADNLFGNVIIEFESRIPQNRSEAEEQLCRYTAIVWSQEDPDRRCPYLCIATDGVRFLTYSPSVSDPTTRDVSPDDVRLQVLEEADWTRYDAHEVFYWLDRYFCRQEVLPPTSETIVSDFGLRSHAFRTTSSALLWLWAEVKGRSTFAVTYECWDKYLRIVYGSQLTDDQLFVRHTYLATLAKLMCWVRVSELDELPGEEQILEMLRGGLFKSLGIDNFIEEDFFSWLGREGATTVGVGAVRWLFSLLRNYNLRQLSEDVLKSLYQELVDPETRHDLGEFYTPDWLAHRMVRKLLHTNDRGALLDPACGSGTFLYLAIREKRERLGDSQRTLHHILASVYGIDIHPLAVIIAKTNYMLALGDLLKRRQEAITIPVYLADSIRLPEFAAKPRMAVVDDALVNQLPGYRVELDGHEVHLPECLVENVTLYDRAIELVKDFAQQNRGTEIAPEMFRAFLVAQSFQQAEHEALVLALFAIAETLKHMIEIDRDTIWAFVLKNAYKPLFFKRRFDFIMGNPPWISFRYMEPAYQAFVKRQITREYMLLRGRADLITHMEVATLFLLRSADLYLKSGGSIAFVLPRSVFSADQHDGLRRRTFKFVEQSIHTVFWRELWDCDSVEPLFNVPACVLIADKDQRPQGEVGRISPIAGQIVSGKLERKNASLEEAEEHLATRHVELSLHTRGKRSFWATGDTGTTEEASYYKSEFAQGATIVPRCFWFVRVKPSPLGFNPRLPPLETDPRSLRTAKKPYRDLKFEGNVESRFLCTTVLSSDLLPFGHLAYRLVVLPIQGLGNHYRLISPEEARQSGCMHLAGWLERVETEWTHRRSAKASRTTSLGWLDYRAKVTRQNPQARFRVTYNASGTYLVAAVISAGPVTFTINGQEVTANTFVADYTTYYYEATRDVEALYLASVLNAPVVDKLIKPMQARGLWGPRHIVKKVLELPIPRFDDSLGSHQRLAELGQQCTDKVAQWLASGGPGKIKSIGKLRSMVRGMLREELGEIDALVRELLT